MRSSILASLTVVLALLLGACSNPKAANKENFSKALDQYFSTKSTMGYLPINLGPVAAGRKDLTDMVNAGLLESPVQAANGLVTYKPTQDAQKYFRKDCNLMFGCREYLKFVTLVVDKVENFTKPAAQDGKQVAFVTFSGHFEMLPWTKKMASIESDSQDKMNYKKLKEELLAKPMQHVQAELYLTDKGWQTERIINPGQM